MTSYEIETHSGNSKVGWFAAGAVAVAAAIGLFLYADGYFDQRDTVELRIDMPQIIVDPK